MADVTQLYQVVIGFSQDRGYAAVVTDLRFKRHKGIKGNSIEQIMSRLRRVVIDEESKRKHFPLESEPSRIVLP